MSIHATKAVPKGKGGGVRGLQLLSGDKEPLANGQFVQLHYKGIDYGESSWSNIST